jgi:hypothetical protein
MAMASLSRRAGVILSCTLNSFDICTGVHYYLKTKREAIDL